MEERRLKSGIDTILNPKMDSSDPIGLVDADSIVPEKKESNSQDSALRASESMTSDSKLCDTKASNTNSHGPADSHSSATGPKVFDPKLKGKAVDPEVVPVVLSPDRIETLGLETAHPLSSTLKTSDPKLSNRSDHFKCKEVSDETKIQSSWEFAQQVGESDSMIHVRNIRTSIPIARDAWGRQAQRQPVSISMAIFLRVPFESASAEDAVMSDTVHYGTLSKAVLSASTEFADEVNEGNLDDHGVSLQSFLEAIARILTNEPYPYTDPSSSGDAIVLPHTTIKALELTAMLPKATLMGSGVSYASGTTYNIDRSLAVSMRGKLTLHELRIPTLIGVNPNERLAKQLVVATIEIDRWVGHLDLYNELEEIVVKASSLFKRYHRIY